METSFQKEKIFIAFLLITFFLNLFLWFFVYLNYKNLKEMTVIHYSVLTGVDRVDRKIYLFETPLIGLVILIVNFILIIFLSKEKILNYFLVFSSFLVNLSLVISAILLFSL